jgi:hypothetical protein
MKSAQMKVLSDDANHEFKMIAPQAHNAPQGTAKVSLGIFGYFWI